MVMIRLPVSVSSLSLLRLFLGPRAAYLKSGLFENRTQASRVSTTAHSLRLGYKRRTNGFRILQIERKRPPQAGSVNEGLVGRQEHHPQSGLVPRAWLPGAGRASGRPELEQLLLEGDCIPPGRPREVSPHPRGRVTSRSGRSGRYTMALMNADYTRFGVRRQEELSTGSDSAIRPVLPM